MQIPGITQVQVHERSGLTFSRGLRAVLRQDPDVVLVGEVRDQETAELALRASLTGHLVLTTLHTTSAVGSITRLVDMGVEPYLVASSLTAVVAQRLVRRVCPACAVTDDPDAELLRTLGVSRAMLRHGSPRRGTGCAECGRTGYRGRTGVFEVLPVDPALRRVLMRTPDEHAIARRGRRPADHQGRGGRQGLVRRDDVRRGPAGQPAGLIAERPSRPGCPRPPPAARRHRRRSSWRGARPARPPRRRPAGPRRAPRRHAGAPGSPRAAAPGPRRSAP